MRHGTSGLRPRVFGAVLVLAAAAAAQENDDVEAMRRRLKQQDEKIAGLSTQLEAALTRLNDVEKKMTDELVDARVEDALKTKLKIYQRPTSIDIDDRKVLFTSGGIEGGLFFTGLFRSRFELRQNNVDLNSGDGGLDDSGARLNGRFRLGIGASFLGDETTSAAAASAPSTADAFGSARYHAASVTALTEFQAYGTFANNSFVTTQNAQQLPQSFSFSLLAEPYEQIGLYQGFLRVANVLADDVTVRVGRQEIVLGNQLLFGNNSFYDGTVHDAIRFDYGNRLLGDEFAATFFYAKEAASDNGIPGPIFDFDEDDQMALYLTYAPKGEDWTVDGYWSYFSARSALNGGGDLIATGSTAFYFDGAYTPLILGHFHTLGARGQWSRIPLFGGSLTLSGELAYQTGGDSSLNIDEDGDTINDFPHRSIHGWNFELVSNFRLYDPKTASKSDSLPILAFQYYLATGGGRNIGVDDGDPTNDFHEHLGFQPMFVNRHFEFRPNQRNDEGAIFYPGGGRYGNMDAIPLDNVHALKLAFSFMATPELELGAGIVHAITESNQGYGSSSFGTELDLFGTYYFRSNIQFGANVSVFFPGSSAKRQANNLFFDQTDPTAGRADDDAAFAFYLQALLQF